MILLKHSYVLTHFFVFFAVLPLSAAFTSFERFFRATISLKRSRSVIVFRASRAASFLAQAVAFHLFMVSPSLKAFFKPFSRAPRNILEVKSVRLKRLIGII